MEDKFLTVAKEAALEAGKIITSYIGKKQQYSFKNEDKSDFATQADFKSQEKIVEILTQNFPNHNIIAEENLTINHNSKYTWAVDPLDGTISFASGMPFFAVSIGLLMNNQPIAGVIYHVERKDLYWAQSNSGAYLNDKKISVSKTNKLADAVIAVGIGSTGTRHNKLKEYFIPLLDKVRYVYIVNGGAVLMAYLAKGSLDATPNKAWIWDQAAAGIIITEAGGKVSDRYGNPVDWSKDKAEFIASNGLIHDEILEVLSSSS